jgi:hypothetical protein
MYRLGSIKTIVLLFGQEEEKDVTQEKVKDTEESDFAELSDNLITSLDIINHNT